MTNENITLTPTETLHAKTIPLAASHPQPHPTNKPLPKPYTGAHPNPSTPLYFAYGSNLSPTQMRSRCAFHPAISGTPVALARLDGWRWFINQMGYANVYPPVGLRSQSQSTAAAAAAGDGEGIPQSGDEDAVFGVLYEMARDDERLLDGYEGVDWDALPSSSAGGVSGGVSGAIRPREQGSGDYNKWYLPAKITRWLDDEQRVARGEREEQTVLVYVDEERVRVGPPKKEYIARMDRAIREALELGFPAEWAGEVMMRVV